MNKGILLAAIAASALVGTAPASAQVRVVVDGQVHDVPDGVVRVISWRPGGRQTVRDERFHGRAAPGGATITNVETTEQDARGRPTGISIVTRIEPIRIAARAPATYGVVYAPPAAPAAAIYASSAGYPPPAPPAVPASAAPTSPADSVRQIGYWAEERKEPGVLRIHRDPASGHFITGIRINGVLVRAIVDTGAANTILSPADAHATGADAEIIDTQRMVGIGGYTMLNIARIRSLEVGGQNLGGFTTPVGQAGLGFTLLGQSEIARLGRIVIEDGTMTITPRGVQMSAR